MAANPLTDPNWATETTDRVVTLIDSIRSQTTTKVVYAARGLVFGVVAAVLGVFAAVLAIVLLLRGLQALLELATTWERAVYLSYFIVGIVFTIAGMILFRMRNTAAS
jgi:hypothetical protein